MDAISLLSRAVYRAGQFRRALNPRLTSSERSSARHTLGPRLYPLFESMQRADQRHCMDVYETLLGQGWTDDAVLQAALLHDCGKGSIAGGPVAVWHRVAYVLLPSRTARRAAARLSAGMRTLHHHDEAAVRLAREFGAGPEVVELLEQIGGRRPPDDRGAALKAADELC